MTGKENTVVTGSEKYACQIKILALTGRRSLESAGLLDLLVYR